MTPVAAWAVGAAGLGVLLAWALTVPLHRFKELRPLAPGVPNRSGPRAGDITVRAVVRHARCPRCRRDHRPSDVVPVLGWGRGCPGCGRHLPATAVGLQSVLPVALALTVAATDPPGSRVPYLWFLVVLAAVSVVDQRILLIPWWMPWAGAVTGLGWMLAEAGSGRGGGSVVVALLAAAGSGAVFWALWRLAPGQLGFGDVRLAALIGLYLGWWHPALVPWGLFLGSVVGLFVGLVQRIARRGRHFPFGPSLAVGAALALWSAPAVVP